MKVAITAQENNMQSVIPLDMQHTNYILIVNTENAEQYKFIPNMYNKSISGAEIFCSQFLIRQEVELFICGKYDSQAKDLLIIAGIKIEEKPGKKLDEIIGHILKQKKENNYET